MRRKDREITDFDRICRILEESKILHLGLIDGDYPSIVPLHYGYTVDTEAKTITFYIHCAKEGHKLDLIRASSKVFVQLECGVALISGQDNPCAYGASYASFMGRGIAELVSSKEEKAEALQLLMLQQTGRKFEIHTAMTEAVEVVRVTVADYSAKSRPSEA